MKIKRMILLLLIIIIGVFIFSTCVQTFTGDSSYPSHTDAFGRSKNEAIIKGVLMVIIGLVGTFVPKQYMTLGQGWKYKGPIEPSEASIAVTRLIGGVFILFGILVVVL